MKHKQKLNKHNCISETRFKQAANHYLDSMTQESEEDYFTYLIICLITQNTNKLSMTDEFIEIAQKAFDSYAEDMFKLLEEMTNWGSNSKRKRNVISSSIIKQCAEHIDSMREGVYE